jgi:hypothetical protein
MVGRRGLEPPTSVVRARKIEAQPEVAVGGATTSAQLLFPGEGGEAGRLASHLAQLLGPPGVLRIRQSARGVLEGTIGVRCGKR